VTTGAAGAAQPPVDKPIVEAGQWTEACLNPVDSWSQDFKVDSTGRAFFSRFGGGANGPPSGNVETCTSTEGLKQIAWVLADEWPRGATLLMSEEHLLMGSVHLAGIMDPLDPASIVEWKQGAANPYGTSPRNDRVLLAESAQGALFSIYPDEHWPALREHVGSDWVDHGEVQTSANDPEGSRGWHLRALAASPSGKVYLAYSAAKPAGTPEELNIQVWQGDHWELRGGPSTPFDPNPVLRVAPDETMYLATLDTAARKLRVFALIDRLWQELGPSLDIYDSRDMAHLELDAQGRPLVVADDLKARISSVFTWRDEKWVQLGPPLGDYDGCSIRCPLIAVAPNGELYGVGQLRGKATLSHYQAP
jgi:hypothetical protein